MSLIHCPWCNNDGDRYVLASYQRFDPWSDPYKAWFVQCECGARGPNAGNSIQAEELWNKRPKDPKTNQHD